MKNVVEFRVVSCLLHTHVSYVNDTFIIPVSQSRVSTYENSKIIRLIVRVLICILIKRFCCRFSPEAQSRNHLSNLNILFVDNFPVQHRRSLIDLIGFRIKFLIHHDLYHGKYSSKPPLLFINDFIS